MEHLWKRKQGPLSQEGPQERTEGDEPGAEREAESEGGASQERWRELSRSHRARRLLASLCTLYSSPPPPQSCLIAAHAFQVVCTRFAFVHHLGPGVLCLLPKALLILEESVQTSTQ